LQRRREPARTAGFVFWAHFRLGTGERHEFDAENSEIEGALSGQVSSDLEDLRGVAGARDALRSEERSFIQFLRVRSAGV
jgi:hypothetical protein